MRCLGAGVVKDGMMSLCLGTAGVVHAYSSKDVRIKVVKSRFRSLYPGIWQIEANSSSAASSIEWFKKEFCQVEEAYAQNDGNLRL